ncbi:MAG: hypothetical protein HN521_20030 [Candidatus Latescibacteria bacterium]|nr:hypothetical protein [Candidatus Latescibacterota bacterium]
MGTSVVQKAEYRRGLETNLWWFALFLSFLIWCSAFAQERYPRVNGYWLNLALMMRFKFSPDSAASKAKSHR